MSDERSERAVAPPRGNVFLPQRDLKACGARVHIYPGAIIVGPEWVEIGNDVIVDSLAIIVASEACPVYIGNFVHLAAHSSIAGGPVTMHDFSGLSMGARLFGGTDDYGGGVPTNPTVPKGLRRVDRSGIVVSRHALVGANSVVMPGVILGEGAAIGANSLVKRHVPKWEIWAGTPAKCIKKRKPIPTTVEAVRKFVTE